MRYFHALESVKLVLPTVDVSMCASHFRVPLHSSFRQLGANVPIKDSNGGEPA